MPFTRRYILLLVGYAIGLGLVWLFGGRTSLLPEIPAKHIEYALLCLILLGWLLLLLRQVLVVRRYGAMVTMVPIAGAALALLLLQLEFAAGQVVKTPWLDRTGTWVLYGFVAVWTLLALRWWFLGPRRWNAIAETISAPMFIFVVIGLVLVFLGIAVPYIFGLTILTQRIEDGLEILGYLTMLFGVVVAHLSWPAKPV